MESRRQPGAATSKPPLYNFADAFLIGSQVVIFNGRMKTFLAACAEFVRAADLGLHWSRS